MLYSFYQRNGTIFKAMTFMAGVHLLGTTMLNLSFGSSFIVDITDYLEDKAIKPLQKFQIYGVVVPGTFGFDPSTGCYFFDITNFKETISVLYKGKSRIEFKEGDNIVLSAYYTDPDMRNRLVAFSYINNHSMEVENWQGTTNKLRENNPIFSA